ncbi:MAG: MarR family transcriptional regulator [Pseudonocardia sp.]|nr:MarR family transcriptional regulator [Pseudonocardia sp.]
MSKQVMSTTVLDAAAFAAEEFGRAVDAIDEAAAAAFDVNRTDLRLIGEVVRRQPQTAGALATAAGLSPAATTTAIQRLVRAGWATREVDGTDRRRAVVTPTPAAHDLIERIYGPVEEAGRRELARWSTAEITLITEFLRHGRDMQLNEARRIRDLGPHRGA